MNVNSFENNPRIIPFPELSSPVLDQPLSERIVNVALPFLKMHPSTFLIATGFDGARRIYDISRQAHLSYSEGHNDQFRKELVKGAIIITTIALTILQPTLSFIGAHSVEIISNLAVCASLIRAGKFEESRKHLLKIAFSLIQILSVTYLTPELLALSFLTKAALDLYESSKEFSKDRYLEGVANLLLAFINARQAIPHMQFAYEDMFLEKMSQLKLNEMFSIPGAQAEETIRNSISQPDLVSLIKPFQQQSSKPFILDQYLRANGYSRNLNDLAFEELNGRFNFHYLRFQNCTFTKSEFDESKFMDSQFIDCDFSFSSLTNSIFERTDFISSTFTYTVFNWSTFKEVNWIACDLSGTSFNDASFFSSLFENCILFETCFFDSKAKDTKIVDSDLTDTLLLNSKEAFAIEGGTPHQMTRPIIGIPWHFDGVGPFTHAIHSAIRDNNGIPFTFEYSPPGLNTQRFDSAVRKLIRKGQSNPRAYRNRSISQVLIDDAQKDPVLKGVFAFTKRVSCLIDGLIIPGGNDIHPELYGKTKESRTLTDNDFVHSMTEIGMIHQAEMHKIPTMGICRGAQMINVFFGGTLKQHVDNHKDSLDILTYDSTLHPNLSRLTAKILEGDPLVALSMHHQANDRLGRGIRTILSYDNVPKLLISDNENFILSQIHPEIYSLDIFSEYTQFPAFTNNRNFFVHLADQASLKRNDKHC